MNLKQLEENIRKSSNTLKYFYRLSIPLSEHWGTDETAVIKSLADQTLEQCKPFLTEGYPYFFGFSSSQKETLFSSVDFTSRWGKILLDDAAVRFYAVLRDTVSESSPVNTPTAMRYTFWNPEPDSEGESDLPICGMEFLINKGYLTLDNDMKVQDSLKYPPSKKQQKYLNSRNSAYRSRLNGIDECIEKAYPHHRSSIIVRSKIPSERKEEVLLGNLEYAGILHNASKRLNALVKICLPCKNFYQNDCEKYLQLSKDMLNGLNSKYLMPADRIYAKYQLENVFHFGLSNCLYQNIAKVNARYDNALLEDRTINALARCVKLPNIYSRNLIVNSAFTVLQDVLKGDNEFETDFFANIRNDLLGIVVYESNPCNIYSDPIALWLTKYQRMIDYLADFIFPLFESLFMVALFESVSKRIAKKGSVNSQSVFSYIFRLLANYLNEGSVFDAMSMPTQERAEFVGLSHTLVDLNIVPVRGDVKIYKRCVSNMTQETKVKAPLTMQDVDVLLPQKKALQQHIILQVANVSERIVK